MGDTTISQTNKFKRLGNKELDLQFYRFTLDSLPVGTITVNPEMKITSFNPWAESLTGYNKNEALGQYCGSILRGGMCKSHCPIKTTIDSRRPIVRVETTIQKKDGETIPVRMHTAALLDNEGGIIGGVEAFQDISFIKAAERERDNLISMFAHDMKSSLTIIGGFVLRLLKKKTAIDNEKHDKYLGIIQKETDKLDFLVNDFIEFSRLRTGKLHLNFQATSLDKELTELFESYQSKASQAGINLEFLGEEILPVIQADPNRLRRVFINLLDNAYKFSPKGSTVTISVLVKDREVMVSIKDEGQGIDPADLPFIFDIFHRGKESAGKSGAGIGLAAVKTIVEGHRGKVSVSSELGKGSTFTVILPKSGSSEK